MKSVRLLIGFILMLHTVMMMAQQDLTLFLMHDVPQANFVNPAVQAACPLVIGVPGLSSVHVNYSNTAFTAGQLLVSRNDSLYFSPGEAVKEMNGIELISAEAHYTPIYLGLWIKQSYWTFAITEKVVSYNTINQNAAQLAWEGNYPAFTGDEVSFKGTRVNASHYREYALGWAHRTGDRMQLGIRGKLLFGKGNIYMPRTKGGLYTSVRDFGLDLRLNTVINSSFPFEVTTDAEGYVSDVSVPDDTDWKAYMMNKSNIGLGFDFGFIYDYDERTTISGSLLDVGFINWKTDVYKFESEGTFQYSGSNSADGFDSPDYLENIGDSLENIFTPKPSSKNYVSPLVPHLYLGATRIFTDHLNAGLVIRNEMYRNKFHPSLSLSANTYGYEVLNASLSYSAINGDYFNLGAGVGVKLGAFHIHAVTDNILAFFDLSNTRSTNLRFGLSIVPGCGEPKEKKKVSRKGISALPCYFNPYRKKSRK